ncbi:HdeD family acid-resistance protein [Aurantimonas endophytica]|uniref:Uncharacterized membrane protein HdeD (DUF308 family) n=1 Tax=Aurantimonas endophytica TaxID=1522175 RepID=A0A7W6MRR2_9HYPH|nr:HdeD family acid-resistance protein [Aurantimonas endophytica]MBB4005239.1 uncharacterized membrane protein HdeD (DUF308 family) [Aurantimonas endophytica]MCO6406099.1 HdeD family acid-resistance protein [Aurantimonas endophytica]
MTVDPAPRPRPHAGPSGLAERYLHDHWKFYAFQGALMILVGLLALLAPWAATLASTLFFGWLLVFGGIVGTVSAFRARGAPGFWSNLILAVLAILLGLVIIYDPFAGSVTLTWMLALYFLMSGIINIVIAQAVRASTGRFWLLLVSGVINIALAIFLVLGLPGTAVWAIGLFLAVSFISSGAALLFAALGSRNGPAGRTM